MKKVIGILAVMMLATLPAFGAQVLKDIHFDTGKYDIRPEDATILREIATFLIEHPNVKIQIEGHCDERGNSEYNLALSERRGNSAKNHLISLGVSADRILTISYVRKDTPLELGHNEKAWAKNRRVHFVISSE